MEFKWQNPPGALGKQADITEGHNETTMFLSVLETENEKCIV